MDGDLVLAALGLRWVLGWYLGGRVRTLQSLRHTHSPHTAADPMTTMSVVIPARNEAATLPALLRSLAVQTLTPLQIIVVDDHSSDGTADVAAHAGAVTLRGKALPPGWLGKPWACAQGAEIAAGDVLVFLDADTVASPDLLRSLSPIVTSSRGLVSVAPYHATQRAYELASGLFNLIALMGTGTSSLRRGARVTGAFGPCLAMRAENYAAIGGHAAVRGEVLEDVALARVCAAYKRPVVNLAGGADLRYRMYPEGFWQLVEGWSKNFAAGAGSTPVLRLIAIVAWMSGVIESGVVTSVGVMRMMGGGPGPSWAYVVFYALYASQLWFLLRRIGNTSVVAPFHPIAAFMFLSICARSLILHLRGEVTWKQRTITRAASKRPSP